MHVTLVSPVDLSSPGAGGTRSYVLGLAERLHGRGLAVSIVARGERPPIPGVEFAPVRSPPRGVRFLVGLSLAALRAPIPRDSVIHVQRPDALVAFRVAKRRNPKVCTLHGIPSQSVRQRRGAVLGFLYDALERQGMRRTDRVIAVDSATAEWCSKRYPWTKDRMHVIPTAVDTDKFRPMDRDAARARFDVRADRVALYAGRLSPEKRVDSIIHAIRDVPNAELLVAGDGPEAPRLRRAAEGAPARFLGAVPHDEMPLLLNAADVLVLASEFEGMPTVALEALACGKPVVAPPVGGLTGIVVPGRTGWLVSRRDMLSSTLRDALPRAQSLQEACVAASRPFAWGVVVERVMETYREAAA